MKMRYNQSMNKHKHYYVNVARIILSLLVFAAIGTQFVAGIQNQSNLVHFFSFFTIQSNILAATILLIVGIGSILGEKATSSFTFLRGGATLYMVMTGIIFALLLSGLQRDLQTTIPWVNTVLHYLMPAVMLVDWLLFPPKKPLPFRISVWWLVYPALYLAFSLVVGSSTQWYPYPFMNPLTSSWEAVAATCSLIAVGIVLLTWLISRWSATVLAKLK